MDVDNFLKNIGQFGPFQIRILAFFLFIFFPVTYQTLIMVFMAYEPPWMCTENSTACLLPNATGQEIFSTATKPIELYRRRCSLNRTEWKFADTNLYEGPHRTIVTDFDLVCDRSIYAWLANSIFYIGWAIGALVLGMISDKYGRRSVLFPSLTCVIITAFAMSFSEAIWLVILFRILIGFFEGGCILTMFVLACELVGPAKRALSSTMVWFYFSLVLMVMGLEAYFIRDWQTMCIIISAPFIFTVLFYKFVPESVRWLLVHGKKEQALNILTNVAKVNKKEMPTDDLAVPASHDSKGFLELFRGRKMALMTLVQCYAWFINGMVYYGVSLSSGELGGSIYLNFVVTSLVGIPGNYLVIDNSNRFGRKKTVIGHFIAGAICCIAVSFIPSGTDNTGFIVGRVTLGSLGKLFIIVSFNTIYIWSAEIFPTVVRNTGMGLLIITSRIGAAASPFVVQMSRISAILPFTLMGAGAFLAAFSCIILPEIRGMPTREVVGDEVVMNEMAIKDDTKTKNDNQEQERQQNVA
ncbi:organic cation transporter protein isoform X2 [Exaiptasia diaphana]|uniref:Major facilitator superfamily (MFS) profile domain-containing protein n=1 Tax=Exaiptasia diaphana TaxID=2652724 RepID=A0A913XI67_EXADI|nr:organic cation transporter protein isoform X2 [Exaiptasia diaphana]KXJ11859.1 Organic cation transporter protein [Exaiptasia diaphana]